MDTWFYTSSFDIPGKKERPCFVGLPSSLVNRTFLQTPLLHIKPTSFRLKEEYRNTSPQQPSSSTLQQTPCTTPKSPSNTTSIYSQPPLPFISRSRHVSQYIEKWLCHPMDRLKNVVSARLSQDHHLRSSSVPSTSNSPSSPILFYNDSLSVSTYDDKTIAYQDSNSTSLSPLSACIQEHMMGVQCTNLPIVCVTDHVGNVPLPIKQVETHNLSVSSHAVNAFVMKCQLQSQRPVFIHRHEHGQQLSSPMSCNFEYSNCDHLDAFIDSPMSAMETHTPHHTLCLPTLRTEEVSQDSIQNDIQHFIKEQEHYMVKKQDMPTATGVKIYQEMYQEGNNEEFGLYSSSEESSEDDHLQDSDYDDTSNRAHEALLRLAQDTLQYIQSSNEGKLTEELYSLKTKIYDYCQENTSTYNL